MNTRRISHGLATFTLLVASCSPPAELQTAEQELEGEKEKLEELARTLSDLQERRRVQIEAASGAGESELRAQSEEVASLSEEIRQTRQLASELDATAAASGQVLSITADVAKESIEADVQSLLMANAETKEQIRYWELNPWAPNVQRQHLDELGELDFLQRQQIDELRRQKSEVSAGLFFQGRLLGSAIQEQKSSLMGNEIALRDRIAALQNEMARQQSLRSQARMSLSPLANEIRNAQRAYESQRNRVQVLEASLRAAEARSRTETQ